MTGVTKKPDDFSAVEQHQNGKTVDLDHAEYLSERFNAAAEGVKNLTKKPTDQELLDLYALFKQGSIGDNQTSKPGFLDMKGKYKWEAWTKVKGKPQDEAKEEYIKMVEVLFSKYS